MNGTKRWSWLRLACAASVAIFLAACASAPSAPQLLQAYERDIRLGQELIQQGRLADGRKAYLRALDRARINDDSTRMATVLIALADTELSLEQPASACARLVEAAREVAAVAYIPARQRLLWQLALARAECALRADAWSEVAGILDSLPALDSPSTARETTLAADDIASLKSHRLNQLALATLKAGNAPAALGIIEAAVVLARPLASSAPLAASLANRALVRHALADVAGAVADAENALQLDRERHDPRAIAESHALLARLWVTTDAERAGQHRRRATEIFTLTGQHERIRKLWPASPN